MVEKMKKQATTILCVTILFCMLLATGCWDRPFYDSTVEGNRLSKEILGYLENDDAEGLKSMFCEITRESPTLDEEIQAALEFFEGKITDYEKITVLTSSEESVRDGQIVFYFIGPYVKDIETDAGKVYTIKTCTFLVHAKDEKKVGVSEILIADGNGDECVVGEFLDDYS